MTIITKYLGPTNYREARIKVTTEWSDNEKVVKTYSFNHAASDVHADAAKKYLTNWGKIMRESKLFDDDIIDIICMVPRGPWYVADTETGYSYTNIKSRELT